MLSEEEDVLDFEYFDKMSFKCCFVGGKEGVGVTSLLVTYDKGQFPESEVPVVYNHFSKELTHKDTKFQLKIWDASGNGNEKPQKNTSFYDTDCFVLCFDMIDRESFNNISDRVYEDLKSYNLQDTPILLVGLKYDLFINEKVCKKVVEQKGIEMKPVDIIEAEELLERIEGFKFIQCSSKILFNVQEIFVSILSYLQEPYVPKARREKEEEEKKKKLEENEKKSKSGLFASFSKKKLMDEISEGINYDFDPSDDEDM